MECKFPGFFPVFFHDILAWIRIRIQGFMPLTNASGSGSCYFRHWPSRCQQKLIFKHNFFCLLPYFLKVHLHYFSKIKSQKEPQNSRTQDFSYYFCMMIEGYGSRAGSGFIPLTSGSGSGRPKNTWIRDFSISLRRYTVIGKQLLISNDRNRFRWVGSYRPLTGWGLHRFAWKSQRE